MSFPQRATSPIAPPQFSSISPLKAYPNHLPRIANPLPESQFPHFPIQLCCSSLPQHLPHYRVYLFILVLFGLSSHQNVSSTRSGIFALLTDAPEFMGRRLAHSNCLIQTFWMNEKKLHTLWMGGHSFLLNVIYLVCGLLEHNTEHKVKHTGVL